MQSDFLNPEKSHVSIKNIRPASISEWTSIWKQCEYATYFQSVEWAEIWHAYTKGKIRLSPFLITFSDGNKAILPLAYKKIFKGLVKLFVLSVEDTYGGWLSADQLDSRHAVLLVNFIKQKFGNLVWRLNPYDQNVSRIAIPTNWDDETHVINLASGDFNSVYASMSKHTRQAIKRANKNGIIARLASQPSDWRDYYKAYQDNLARWGDKLLGEKYEWSFFKELFQRNSPNIKLWLATLNENVIGGVLCFSSKTHVVEWHSSVMNAYYKLGVVDLLICEIIKDSIRKGYIWFDFNPSGGLKGVKRHKEFFGAETLRCPYVLSASGSRLAVEKVGGAFSALRQRFIESNLIRIKKTV